MPAPIHGIGTGPIATPTLPSTPDGKVTGESGSQDFGKTLAGAVGDASKAEKAANDAAQRFAAGDPQVGLHEVMIAAEKANISVRYAVTLKNKLLEAYRELMNTPL